MFCPKCASQVSESESVCPKCGAAVDPDVYKYKPTTSYPHSRSGYSSGTYSYNSSSSSPSSYNSSSYSNSSYSNSSSSAPKVRVPEDMPSFGMNVALGYIFAPIGLIVAIIQLIIGKTPNKTTSLFKSIGVAAIVSFISTLLWIIVVSVIGLSKMGGWGILVIALISLISLGLFIGGIIFISKMTKKDVIKAQADQGGVPFQA